MTADPRRWYVVYTQPAAEAKAVSHLRRQSFVVRWLRYLDTAAVATASVIGPYRSLFPRYLFVSLDPAVDQWRAILGTYGVSDIIRHGDTPTPLPERVAADLFARAGDTDLIRLPDQMRPGTRLRVVDGTFTDHEALFLSRRSGQRVSVLLSILGGQVPVELPARAVVSRET